MSRIFRSATPWIVVGAAAAVAWPVCAVREVPFLDYPGHLGGVATIHRIDEPPYAAHFVVDWLRAKYWLFHLLSARLAWIFGVELATRLVVAASLAAVPIGVALWLRAHGRPALLGALAAFVAIHRDVIDGFLPHMLGFALALFGLVAHARALTRPSLARFGGLAAIAVLAYRAHPIPFVWMGVGCILQTAFWLPRQATKRALDVLGRTAIAAVPVIALALLGLQASGFHRTGEVRSRLETPPVEEGAFGPRRSIARSVERAIERAFHVYEDESGFAIVAAYLVVLGACVALRGREARPVATTFAPEAIVAATLLLYLIVPEAVMGAQNVGRRFLPMAMALAPAFGPLALDAAVARRAVGAAILGGSLVIASMHLDRFRAASSEIEDLDGLLATAAPGKRLLGLVFDRRSEVIRSPIHLHAAQYYQIRRGGLAAWSWSELSTWPVQFREGAAPPATPAFFEWHPGDFDPRRDGAFYDYYLVRTKPGENRVPVLEKLPGARRIDRRGRWQLFAGPELAR